MPSALAYLCGAPRTAGQKGNHQMWRTSVVVLLASACGMTVDETSVESYEDNAVALDPCGQPQMFGTQQHSGLATCSGIRGALTVRDVVPIDPSAIDEHDQRGFYGVQVGAALSSGRNVWVGVKRGFTSIFNPGSQTWGVKALTWSGGLLIERWNHDVAFKAVDSLSLSYTNFNEQLFGPALTISATGTPSLYAPGFAGTIERIDAGSGKTAAVINPLVGTVFSGDPNTFVMSGLTTDRAGNVYYTAAALNRNFGQPARGSWLVRVAPDNSTTLVPWSQIATAAIGVPQPTDQCEYSYDQAGRGDERPFPPTPNEPTFTSRCGGQRPPVNAAPAVSSDGRTVVVVSSDNNSLTSLYLIALDGATLRPLRASKFQGNLQASAELAVRSRAVRAKAPGGVLPSALWRPR